jgi:hypothetical protein
LIALMTWLWPSLLGLSRIVRPDTILRWIGRGFGSTGAGDRAIGQDGLEFPASYASSSDE